MIIAIRPQPGCAATIAAGRAMGLSVEGHPLFAIRGLDWKAPDPENFDALLVGSANAFRHSGPQIAQYKSKPVHVVGAATARAAREAGFDVASVGTGGLQGLIDTLEGSSLRFLRLAGAEHVGLDLSAQISVETQIVYASTPVPMSADLADKLHDNALVLLHSAIAAQHFAAECDRLELDRTQIALAALGPRIAAAAGRGWAKCVSAPQPRDSALLALTREMGY